MLYFKLWYSGCFITFLCIVLPIFSFSQIEQQENEFSKRRLSKYKVTSVFAGINYSDFGKYMVLEEYPENDTLWTIKPGLGYSFGLSILTHYRNSIFSELNLAFRNEKSKFEDGNISSFRHFYGSLSIGYELFNRVGIYAGLYAIGPLSVRWKKKNEYFKNGSYRAFDGGWLVGINIFIKNRFIIGIKQFLIFGSSTYVIHDYSNGTAEELRANSTNITIGFILKSKQFIKPGCKDYILFEKK